MWGKRGQLLIITIMYIYHALINALSTNILQKRWHGHIKRGVTAVQLNRSGKTFWAQSLPWVFESSCLFLWAGFVAACLLCRFRHAGKAVPSVFVPTLRHLPQGLRGPWVYTPFRFQPTCPPPPPPPPQKRRKKKAGNWAAEHQSPAESRKF